MRALAGRLGAARAAGCLELHPLENAVALLPTAGRGYNLDTCLFRRSLRSVRTDVLLVQHGFSNGENVSKESGSGHKPDRVVNPEWTTAGLGCKTAGTYLLYAVMFRCPVVPYKQGPGMCPSHGEDIDPL